MSAAWAIARAAKLASGSQSVYNHPLIQFYIINYADIVMLQLPFWQQKTLAEMSDSEWESLCDGCGQCCLNKLIDEDTDEIYFTNVACDQLNLKTCQCRNYDRRFELEEDCIKLTRENLVTFEWLPPTCAYRLIGEGHDLPHWHPLLAGSKSAMHGERISVRHIAVRESEVIDWQNHILNKPQWAR
ncbi:ycgn (Fragment) [Yersinia kristensenii]